MSDTPSRTPLPAPLLTYKRHHPSQIPVIQHNCANSNHVLLSLFTSFDVKSPLCIVAIQEPFLVNGSPTRVPNYQLISPPVSSSYKVFTCFYILSSFVNSFSFVPLFFDCGDIFAISITFLKETFIHYLPLLSIYNVYNRQNLRHTRCVMPSTTFTKSQLSSMVLRDFNIHNPISGPERDFTANEFSLSNPYFLAALNTKHSLLNTPGSYTRITTRKSQSSSVIDLCFANTHLLPFIHSWKTISPP
jgi:hypothetical protein